LIADSKAEHKRLESTLAGLDTELATVNAQTAKVRHQVATAEGIIENRERIKSQVKAERAERNKLYSEKGVIGASISKIKHELEKCAASAVKQEDFAKEIETMKAENDRMEAQQAPERSESKGVFEELEKCVAIVEKIKECNEEKSYLKEVEEANQLKEAIEKELVQLQAATKEERVTLAQAKEDLKAYKDIALVLENLQEATLLLSREKDADEKALAVLSFNKHRAMLDVQLKILRKGALILKAAKEDEMRFL
jgi:hypothetical protein